MQHPVKNGAKPPLTRLLLRLSLSAFVIFWAGIVSGKLHISFQLTQFPLVPELALAAILSVGLALGLGACLLEEQRAAKDAAAFDNTTEGDTK